ncbi:DNA-directed DNA polymerase eta rad30 [Varicellaria rhodocarpa]|nr:DNA-directed DNA polymerase eta rad30 [Varicellaria rhodocarpa]
MSSSQPFLPSSPISLTSSGLPRKSRFTYKHLSQLSLSSTSCPLRVIAHIDLDAFYAQCEMVRLNVPEDQPLAVQQWQGLIAINYPARKFGMNRFITITEAKKLCPNLIMQHVATWKEGDEKWAYHEDAFAHIASHKVSLDPYRLESRRILACIKDVLPAPPLQRVEKASVDEVFLDLSAQIHSILLERYPELSGPPPYDDPTENLPRPPTTALDWNTDALVDLDEHETEEDDPDWDDVTILIGSEIVRSVRAAIRERLKYTCSAGIARNKMLAKLGSAHKKPNQQTIVRNRAVQQFLSTFKFTKIRNLGGKLGDQVVSTFGTDQVEELLKVSIDQLKSKLGDDHGSWVYQVIRGLEYNEVNSRTQIKSMLSAKSFRPSINSFEQGVRWLRIFAADIFSRLVEEGVLENKRRPKTMNLHHRQGGQMRSRQSVIPSGRAIDEVLLFDLAKTLLSQVIVDGRAWPCANLQLSVGGFEEGLTGNRGIGGFLIKGEEAKTMRPTSRESERPLSNQEDNRPEKRRKIDDGIQRFFAKKDDSREEYDDDFGANDETTPPNWHSSNANDSSEPNTKTELKLENTHQPLFESSSPSSPSLTSIHDSSESYLCLHCSARILLSQQSEHEDWHFAKDLQASERTTTVSSTAKIIPTKLGSEATTGSKKPESVGAKRGPKKPGGGGVEKGQRKLAFGR